jgi:hypothetical protein
VGKSKRSSSNGALVAVQCGLAFNYGEFATIKIRIMNAFPDAKKLYSIAIA